MTADSESLSKGLAAMSRFFIGDATLPETLQKVSELARDAVGSADVVGVTMIVDGRARTAACTDQTVPEIDAAQYDSGIGPCLDALRHRQVFRIDHMEHDHQWKPFSQHAAAHGVGSAMAVPLVARHEGLGAMNFYARSRAAFSDQDVETGLQFATHASVVLANSQAYWHVHQVGQEMAEAMKSRATIEQAKGIVMGANHCSPEDAAQILVRTAQRENRKLREVAEDLVCQTVRRQEAGEP